MSATVSNDVWPRCEAAYRAQETSAIVDWLLTEPEAVGGSCAQGQRGRVPAGAIRPPAGPARTSSSRISAHGHPNKEVRWPGASPSPPGYDGTSSARAIALP